MNRVNLELYNTDGAQGAARGAGIGSGIFENESQAFHGLELLETLEPNQNFFDNYEEIYNQWLTKLNHIIRFEN
jgi:xylulokinase